MLNILKISNKFSFANRQSPTQSNFLWRSGGVGFFIGLDMALISNFLDMAKLVSPTSDLQA